MLKARNNSHSLILLNKWKSYLLVCICFLGPLFLQGQSKLPAERIFIDIDKSVYLTGEMLWLKIYCIDEDSKQLSGMSKVAYVEILDENAKPIIQEKISITNGIGTGQIFIGKEILSGVYYLKGYTSWMKNFDQSHFFEGNIHIVNPFRSSPVSYHSSNSETDIFHSSNPENNLSLSLPKTVFANREKVSVSLKFKESSAAGNLSVSVYKYHAGFPEKQRLRTYLEIVNSDPRPKIKSIQYPPEIRTPILSGKVKKTGIKAVDIFIPGKSPQYYSIPIGNANQFHTEISPEISADEMVFWTENTNLSADDIEIISPFYSSHQINNPVSFSLNKEHIADLERISLNAQIANAYEVYTKLRGKSNTENEEDMTFYGRPDVVYKLDDYTRFPTLEEVFLEYVRFISKRKRNKKQYIFSWDLYSNENSIANNNFFSEPALVMIDGVPISDLSYVWNLDARLVEKIEIVNRKYFAGQKTVYGVLNLVTYKRDFGGVDFPSDIVKKSFEGMLNGRSFYTPNYEDSKMINSRIPDYRSVLLWESSLTMGNSYNLDFFTGDDHGTYRIEVNGITNAGEFVHQVVDFQVNNNR